MNGKESFGCKRGRAVKAEGEKYTYEKNCFAARVVMLLGTAVLLFFFVFASFGRNAGAIEYSENNGPVTEGAVSVFSKIMLSDGAELDNSGKAEDSRGIYTSVENPVAAEAEGGKWNFWQYLCDSLSELFGVAAVS